MNAEIIKESNIRPVGVEKKVFEFSDQVRHKPGCAVTDEISKLEVSDLKKINCTILWRKQRQRSSAQLLQN